VVRGEWRRVWGCVPGRRGGYITILIEKASAKSQHTSAYGSIRPHTSERDLEEEADITILIENASA
jgi:hypothetical protein